MQGTAISVLTRPPSPRVIRCLPDALREVCRAAAGGSVRSSMSQSKSIALAVMNLQLSCKSLLQVRHSLDGVLLFKVLFLAVGLLAFA